MRTRPARAAAAALLPLALCAAARVQPPPAAGPEGGLILTARTPAGPPRGRWSVAFKEPEIGRDSGPAAVAGGSLRGVVDVDCGMGQFRVAQYRVFTGPRFTGALVLDLNHLAVWRSPRAGTTMARVLAAVCGGSTAAARAEAASFAPEPAAAGPPQPQPPTAPTAPAPSIAARAAQAVVAAAPRPGPGAQGGFYAQLASMPSAEAAREAWEGFQGAAPDVLDARLRRLTPAVVRSRRVWRVLAGGFETRAEAERVCRALVRRSAGCFVRADDGAT